MKRYWLTLAQPTQDKWFRRIWLPFAVACTLFELYLAFSYFLAGTGTWMLAAAMVVIMVAGIAWTMLHWIKTDDRNHARQKDYEVGGPMDSYPVVPSDEATSPFHYAMMRALEGGEGVAIYRDEDGVWRDSSTDEALPIQENKNGPENGAER